MDNSMNGNEISTNRQRKSIDLSADQKRRLKKWFKTQPTQAEAGIMVGVTRNTIKEIVRRGTCNSMTLPKIEKVIAGIK